MMCKKKLVLSVTTLCLCSGLLAACGKTNEAADTYSHSVTLKSSSSAPASESNSDSSSKSSSDFNPTVSPSPTDDKAADNRASDFPKDTPAPAPTENEDSSNPVPADAAEEKTITGYVLDLDDNNIYLDTENPGARTYIGEGEDRTVPFDFSNAVLDIPDFVSGNLRTALNVTVTYYVKDGKNIATYISSDGIEIEPEYFSDFIQY